MAQFLGPFRRQAPSRVPPAAAHAALVTPRTAKIGYLTEAEIFRDLTPAAMVEVDRMTAMSTCPRGRVLYEPGTTGEVLFILKRGRVNIYRLTADGRKLITATLGPGTIFGEMAFIGAGMRGSFAEAAADCTLCALSRADLEQLFTIHPPVAIRLIAVLAARLAEAEEQLEALAFRNVAARLAAALLRLAGEGGQEVRDVSQQQLAEMVGTYRETATQILNEFRAQGLIELHRLRIRILDPVRLRAVVDD